MAVWNSGNFVGSLDFHLGSRYQTTLFLEVNVLHSFLQRILSNSYLSDLYLSRAFIHFSEILYKYTEASTFKHLLLTTSAMQLLLLLLTLSS